MKTSGDWLRRGEGSGRTRVAPHESRHVIVSSNSMEPVKGFDTTFAFAPPEPAARPVITPVELVQRGIQELDSPLSD